MTALLVILTFALLVGADYAMVRRHQRQQARARAHAPPPEPLRAATEAIPPGIFLQPSYTWSRVGEWGEIYVGVHPMLLGLIGTPLEVDFRAVGAQVTRGEPLALVGRGSRRLTVHAPVSGRVDRVNRPALAGKTGWRGVDAATGPWLYRILPDRIADEMGAWLSGDAAARWTRESYQRLRAYLTDQVAHSDLGVAMADGGELPVGILADMDDPVWQGLDQQIAREERATEDRT